MEHPMTGAAAVLPGASGARLAAVAARRAAPSLAGAGRAAPAGRSFGAGRRFALRRSSYQEVRK